MIELVQGYALQSTMPQRFVFLLLTSWLSVGALAADYVVSLSDDLRTLDVRACFDSPPRTLHAGDRAAAKFLRRASFENDTEPLRARGARLRLSAKTNPGCLLYSVDVGAAADERALRRSAFVGQDLLITPEIWLWRPDRAITLRFELPAGVSPSVPWRPVASSTQPWHFVVANTPHSWAAQTAFGHLDTQSIAFAGGSLDIAIVDASSLKHRRQIIDWLHETAAAMTTIYGRFPLPNTQVLVIPGHHSSPVPWGQVLRGGAPAVHFYVDRNATAAELVADWTAFHEFSHLFLPFVGRNDAYFSEGFASYFQNITRARSGNISEQAAWENLLRGFERGRASGAGKTLSVAARRMGRDRNYMRVYWSGAALALMADVALRQRGNKQTGLGNLLGELNACCHTQLQAWSAQRLSRTLDGLADTVLFTPLNQRLAEATTFPDVMPLLGELGVTLRGDQVIVSNDAPLAPLRQAITRRPDDQSKESGRAASQ